MPHFSLLVWVVGLIVTPFLLPRVLGEVMGLPAAEGPLHESRHVSGLTRQFTFRQPMDLKQIKQACRLEKTTLNSFFAAMISLTLA